MKLKNYIITYKSGKTLKIMAYGFREYEKTWEIDFPSAVNSADGAHDTFRFQKKFIIKIEEEIDWAERALKEIADYLGECGIIAPDTPDVEYIREVK